MKPTFEERFGELVMNFIDWMEQDRVKKAFTRFLWSFVIGWTLYVVYSLIATLCH